MAADDDLGCQFKGNTSVGPIRRSEANQLRNQSLGVQTRIWLFATVRPLDCRCVWWSMALHDKPQYVPGTTKQSENSVGSLEAHLSHDVRRRLWFSLDANFWSGGATSLKGMQNPSTVQRNSRLGGTASVPLTSHQSIKISYSNGAYVAYGGYYQNISAGWQYS
jgi:hypothetical protein